MSDVVQVSYTGDLLAHRRCRRAWALEKRAGFHPYEAVQAMEGRLIHHAMQWLTRRYQEGGAHATEDELRAQLERYFRILWSRGIKTAFASKRDTLDRVMGNLFGGGVMDPIVRAAIEGAQHTEYELRAVRKVIPADFGGKSRILLTGILDLVIQQKSPLTYQRQWVWDSIETLSGHPENVKVDAVEGEVEIWDYKGTRSGSGYVSDYVRQVLTYAALYEERTGTLPVRCVLFFINEPDPVLRLLVIPVTQAVVASALAWTQEQVRLLQETNRVLRDDPSAVVPGELERQHHAIGMRLTNESQKQCTTCSLRFDCTEYAAFLPGGSTHTEVDLYNVLKN